jgi:hypothetical protein
MKNLRSILCVLLLFPFVLAYADREVEHTVDLVDPIDFDADPQSYRITQVLSEEGDVERYRMILKADICLEKICKMVHVTLIWNAKGDYVGLETPADEPLTKNDHDPFTKSDYKRLHRILKNPRSPLGKYPLKNFVTSAEKEGLDGVSGATKKRSKNAIVPGAAYSSWVLWNWVNGDINDELERLTEEAES